MKPASRLSTHSSSSHFLQLPASCAPASRGLCLAAARPDLRPKYISYSLTLCSTTSQGWSPTIAPFPRSDYNRRQSVRRTTLEHLHAAMDETSRREPADRVQSPPLADIASGLGIDITSANRESQDAGLGHTPLRTVYSIEDTAEDWTPDASQPFVSPSSLDGLSGSTQYGFSPASTFSPHTKYYSKQSPSIASPSTHAPRVESQASLLSKHHSASLNSAYGEFVAQHKCPSMRSIKGPRKTWMSILTICLSVYSTAVSGLFFFIAVVGPSYPAIRTNGRITASSAAFLTTILAKTVELSFVTIIIALLGQELSRKASSIHRRSGVTLAQLSMRNWITQPGTMISRWESVRYAGLTTLGVVSMVAAVLAMLYTSAATALVQPRLKFGDWKVKPMQGNVRASFANKYHIGEKCPSPLSKAMDSGAREETCVSIEHAAMGYHNYYSYLELWSKASKSSLAFGERPNGTAVLNNDTTVTAPWFGNRLGPRAAFEQVYNETETVIVNNVSLAFPHTGVASAAKDKINNIMQPEDLDGMGVYLVNASVPSPVIHVRCATVSEKMLDPLVFSRWNEINETVNGTSWPDQLRYTDNHSYPFLSGTELDDVFEWGEKYGPASWPPVFPNMPDEYNTVTNQTSTYGRTSIYVLGKGPYDKSDKNPDLNNFLCQMQVSQTPYCYTTYQASAQGATLEAVCGDEDNWHEMQYIASVPDSLTHNETRSKDWPSVAGQWALALALNDGSFGGKSSNARLLTQLLLREPELDPAKPSLAEALAVLAGCTLLQSTLDAPFVPYWDYTGETILEDPAGVYEPFNATLRAQQYASGGSEPYQKAFHVVLLGVFALNVVALLYFALHKTWYTDFSEPPNLFSLAVNSPPSEAFAGCCGTGPQGRDYRVAWTLEQDDGHVFVHSGGRREGDGGVVGAGAGAGGGGLQRRQAWRSLGAGSPVAQRLGKLRRWSREV